MLSAACVLRRPPLRNVRGARGVVGTARGGTESGAGRRISTRTTTQAKVDGSHQRDDERTMRTTNIMAPGLRGGPGTTRMVLLPGVIEDRRMRIRRNVGIGVTARRGVGVPVDPRTVLLLSGPARFLLRTLKTNDGDDAGRTLGVLRRTMHLMLTHTHTHTRGTKDAHTATTPPADADTDRALQRRPLAQRRYRRD